MNRPTPKENPTSITEALWQDPNRMSGAVCFRGTRIPVSILFEYLQSGRLDEFRSGYPDVTPDQIRTVLVASEDLIEQQFLAQPSH